MVIIWTLLVEVYRIKLHTKYQRPGTSRDKKTFKILPICKKWSFCKTSQGQPKVMSFTNFIGPMSPILYTKPQGHCPFSFEEEFKVFLPYMGMVAILIMWPRCAEKTLHSPRPMEVQYSLLHWWPSGPPCFKEEDYFIFPPIGDYVKQVIPWWGYLQPQGYNLNNLG